MTTEDAGIDLVWSREVWLSTNDRCSCATRQTAPPSNMAAGTGNTDDVLCSSSVSGRSMFLR